MARVSMAAPASEQRASNESDVHPITVLRRMPILVVVLIAFLVAPLWLSGYQTHALVIAMIFLLPALGLNLIVGYIGLLSLGQGAFFGIGAYTSALLALHFQTPFLVGLIAAAVVSALVALPLAIPALRLRSHSFVMCTLGILVIAEVVSRNWIDVTRGDMGLSAIPRPEIGFGGWTFAANSTTEFYYLALAVCVIAIGFTYAILASAAGRNIVAIRENETLAESLGINTWAYKLIVFVMTAALAGMGGSLYAHYMTVISPLMFQIYYLITILVIVLGGGPGSLAGVVLGSLVFVGTSEALRFTPELRMVLYGVVLVGLVFWFPKGLAPVVQWLDRKLALPHAGKDKS